MNDDAKTYAELLAEMTRLRQRNTELEAQAAEDRQAAARFRLLAENSTDFISCYTPEGVYLYASPACRSLLGYDPEDLMGHSAYEFFHPDDLAAIAASHAMILEQPMVSTVSYRIRRKDGTYIWFETTSHAIRAEQTDTIVEIYTASRDITERKQMEAALRENRAMLKQILDTVPQSIFWKDKESVYLGCNQVFAAAVGISAPEDIIGKTDFDLPWPRPEAEAYRTDDAIVIASQTPRRHIIEPLQQADGVRLWIDTTKQPLVDSHGEVYGVLGVYEDITARKQAEEALQESEQRLQAILDNSPAVIYLKDLEGRFILVNRQFEKTFHLTQAEMIGKTDYDFMPKESADRYRANDVTILQTGQASQFEESALLTDGAHTVISIKFPIYNPDGSPYGVCGISTDITDLKRAKEALVESELKYRTLFKSMGQGFYVAQILYDGEGLPCDYRYIDVNSAFEHIVGLTRERIIGRSYNELIPPDPESGWLECFKRVALTGVPENYTFSSKIYNSHFEVYAFKPEDGTFAALVKDITESKRVEQALRDSEERYRLLAEAAHDIIFILTRAGKVDYVNNFAAQQIGRLPEDIIGRSHAELFQSGDVEHQHLNLRQVFETGQPLYVENPTQFPNQRIWLGTWLVPIKDEAGQVQSILGVSRDITARKRIEEALEKRIVALTQPLDSAEDIAFENLFNLAELQHLQDLYADAFDVSALITRPDGTPITQPSHFTGLCRDIIRKTAKGAAHCNASDAMAGRYNPAGPNIQPCLSAGLCSAGASISVGGRHIANWLIGQVRNETQDEETIMHYAREIGADEAAFRAAFRNVPVMSQKQFEKVAQVLFVLANQLSTSAYQNIQQARFIAERKQAEAEIRTLNAELEQRVHERTAKLEAANKELQSFAYVVSHDLKAPLRAIARLTQWLVDDYAGAFDATGKEMADLLVGRVKRMDELIDGILNYSRIGRIVGQTERIDLNQLLSTVIDSLAPPPFIRIEVAPDLPVIMGDKIRIQQVFANLIGNALKFMDKPQGHIGVHCADDGAFWKFSITDNGPGIDPKYHAKIFQIFQTLHPRDEVESTGVGLTIVKKIIELYGGKVWVESIVGEGSTFVFTLPNTSQ